MAFRVCWPCRALSSHFAKIFVINLDRRPDRWTHMQSQLRSAAGEEDISRLVERVPAVDGATVDFDILLREGVLSPLGRRRLLEPPRRRLWGMDLTPGAVGCALSHIRLWARIAAAASPRAPPQRRHAQEGEWDSGEEAAGERYLVLEDDCVFPPRGSFEARYIARLQHVPRDGWGLLYLSGLDTAQQCASLMVANGIARVPQFHRTTNAYVVTPHGAQQLLETCVPLTYQLDTMMTMDVGTESGSGQHGDSTALLPHVLAPRCYTLMPPLITQSAMVAGDIQDGEGAKTMEERTREEQSRRKAAGWEDEIP